MVHDYKNIKKFIDANLGEMEKIYDICRSYHIPYLTQAYQNVVEVCKQLLCDIENVERLKDNKDK